MSYFLAAFQRSGF